VIGFVLLAGGPAGLLVSSPGGVGARIRGLGSGAARRFGR